MTKDERWMMRFNEVKHFIETNHRNPSKYAPEEKLMVHFLKRCRKLMNAGEMAEPRLSLFRELLVLSEENKPRINISSVLGKTEWAHASVGRPLCVGSGRL